ncbi:MAG: tetratricopeptide repeat protein, partial [Merismopedia sp. SIO2A8]|nr:tetratricopeptide repeat protein [Merismopedia sp. SIO2A8]
SYEKAMEIDPEFFWSWGMRGMVLEKLGRYQEAIASLTRATEICPYYEDGFYHKARCYAIQGKTTAVIENLQKTFEINPHSYRHKAATDPTFELMRDNKHFQALIQKADG